jgi:hypothetical protein
MSLSIVGVSHGCVMFFNPLNTRQNKLMFPHTIIALARHQWPTLPCHIWCLLGSRMSGVPEVVLTNAFPRRVMCKHSHMNVFSLQSMARTAMSIPRDPFGASARSSTARRGSCSNRSSRCAPSGPSYTNSIDGTHLVATTHRRHHEVSL